MNSSEPLIKYVMPTKFDKEPQKTIWKVENNKCASEIYIQLSEDEDNPHWEKMSIFLEKSLINLIKNGDFIDQCMRLYIYNQDNPLDRISDIIKDHKE